MNLFHRGKRGGETAWPEELRFNRDTARLKLAFDDGFKGEISYELLRVESPSAETRGHGADKPPPPAGKRTVSVERAEPVGRYAVRIVFSDGHNTGLYTWGYLRELAENAKAREKDYLAALDGAGLSRD